MKTRLCSVPEPALAYIDDQSSAAPRLDIRCPQEGQVIGTIPATIGRLTRAAVWSQFVPASSAYRLDPQAGVDLDLFRCPRCGVPLEIVGATQTFAADTPGAPQTRPAPGETRDAVCAAILAQHGQDARHLSGEALSTMTIVLGATRIAIRRG